MKRTVPETPTLAAYRIPEVSDLYRDGRHIRSRADGRYVMLRGVCFGPVAKLPPHLPFRSREDWEKFSEHIDLLKSCGFYTLRLAFIWHALEPECQIDCAKYDEQYADDFFYFVGKFQEAGFTVFLDVHQDLVQAAYGGGGLPQWVKEDGSADNSMGKNTPWWGLNYVLNKALRRTFTQFWLNDITNTTVDPPLTNFKALDRYLDMIEYIAKRSKEYPAVLGIEVINEPHPAELNAEEFEAGLLSDIYRKCIERVRKHSDDLFVMLSPQSDWNVNLRTDKDYRSHLSVGPDDDDRLVFAYHYYDSKLTALNGLHFADHKRDEYIEAVRLGVREAERHGMVPFLTEFGSRQSWMRVVTRKHMHWHFEAVESAAVNATYWNINFYNTKEERDGWMQEDFSLISHKLKPRNLDMATRPYPLVASAAPVSMHYNEHSYSYELVLEGEASDQPTVIYLPYSHENPMAPAPYNTGFKVYYAYALADDVRVEFLPRDNQLLMWLDRSIEKHRIVIVPIDRSIIANSDQVVFSMTHGEAHD